MDCIFDDGQENPVDRLRKEFEPKGIKVYPISAVTGQGVRELLFHIKELLDSCPKKAIVFEQEFFPEDMLINESLPFTVQVDEEDPSVFIVEGPRIEKMLGYTNLDSEKGFAFFQRFLKEGGILDELEAEPHGFMDITLKLPAKTEERCYLKLTYYQKAKEADPGGP